MVDTTTIYYLYVYTQAFKILIAAFLSLLCIVLHTLHCHTLTLKSFAYLSIHPLLFIICKNIF
nr:MAG TPA: hypothetical protein [Caudoviricetes sp.]